MLNGITLIGITIIIGYIIKLRNEVAKYKEMSQQWRQTAIMLSADINMLIDQPMKSSTYEVLKRIGKYERELNNGK